MWQVARVVTRNSAYGVAAQILIKVISFSFTVFIVRQLGDRQFGLYATAAAFIGIVSIFADGGMTGYAIREIAKSENRTSTLLGNMITVRLALSTILLFVNLVVARSLGYSNEIIGFIAIGSFGVLLTAFSGPLQVVLQGRERFDYDMLCNVSNQLLAVGIGALLVWWGWGVPGLLGAGCVAIACTGFIAWRLIRRTGPVALHITPRAWLPLLRAGLPFATITFATMLSFKIDTVFLSLWRTPVEVGWYNVAYGLIFTLVGLLGAFNNAIVPSLSRHAKDDLGGVTWLYVRAVRAVWLLALPVAVGGALLAKRLIIFLYGTPYTEAGVVLQALIWVLPILSLTSFCGAIATVLHRERATARINLMNAAVNITLNLWAIPHFGIMGAAVVTVITETVCLGQYLVLMRGVFPLRSIIPSLYPPIVAAALMAMVLLLLAPLPLGMLIALGALSYGGFLVLSGGFTVADARTLKRLVAYSFLRRSVANAE